MEYWVVKLFIAPFASLWFDRTHHPEFIEGREITLQFRVLHLPGTRNRRPETATARLDSSRSVVE